MKIDKAEPAALRALGTTVSGSTEKFGVDITFLANGRLIGIQRKELKDLFASVEDGRLGEQIAKMANLEVAYLLVEGVPKFTLDGDLVGKQYGQRWTRNGYEGVLWSVAARGVRVIHSRDLNDTIRMVQHLEEWERKAKHTSLDRRPGPRTMFGSSPMLREFAVHLLQSVPGLGPEVAGRIFDAYGLPLSLTVTEKDLLTVKGVGPKLAGKIVKAFTATDPKDFIK